MPFPLVPVLLGTGALGGAAFLLTRKKGVPGAPNAPAGSPVLKAQNGVPFTVGNTVHVTAKQPDGSLANVPSLVTAINGTTLSLAPSPLFAGVNVGVVPPTADVSQVVGVLVPEKSSTTSFSGRHGYADSVHDMLDPVFARHLARRGERTNQGKGWASSGKGTPFPPGFNAPQGWGQHQFGAHGAGARFDSHGYSLGGHGYGRANALAPFGYGRGGGQHRPGGGYAESMSWHSGASSERWPYAGGPQPGRMGCAPRAGTVGASSERWPYGARQWRTNADRPGWPFGPRQAQMGAIDLVGAAYAPPHTHHVFQGTAMGPEAQPDKLVVGRNPWHNVYDKFSGGYDRPYPSGVQKLVVGTDDPIMNRHIMRGKTQGRGW